MGMFDWVEVEDGVDLPEFEDNEELEDKFQTKDFDSVMTTIKITDNGKLLEEQHDVKIRSDEEMERIKEEEGALAALQGSMKRKHAGWEEKDFHGVMEFYNSEYRYNAKFTDGELEDITLVSKDKWRDKSE